MTEYQLNPEWIEAPLGMNLQPRTPEEVAQEARRYTCPKCHSYQNIWSRPGTGKYVCRRPGCDVELPS